MSCENGIAVGICPKIYLDPDTLPLGVDYSLDEQWTGLRWIDGKKVYRRVVDLGNLPASGTKDVPCAIANLALVTKLRGFFNDNLGHMISLPYAAPTGLAYAVALWFNASGPAIRVITGTTRPTGAAYAVIEYTCTDR